MSYRYFRRRPQRAKHAATDSVPPPPKTGCVSLPIQSAQLDRGVTSLPSWPVCGPQGGPMAVLPGTPQSHDSFYYSRSAAAHIGSHRSNDVLSPPRPTEQRVPPGEVRMTSRREADTDGGSCSGREDSKQLLYTVSKAACEIAVQCNFKHEVARSDKEATEVVRAKGAVAGQIVSAVCQEKTGALAKINGAQRESQDPAQSNVAAEKQSLAKEETLQSRSRREHGGDAGYERREAHEEAEAGEKHSARGLIRTQASQTTMLLMRETLRETSAQNVVPPAHSDITAGEEVRRHTPECERISECQEVGSGKLSAIEDSVKALEDLHSSKSALHGADACVSTCRRASVSSKTRPAGFSDENEEFISEKTCSLLRDCFSVDGALTSKNFNTPSSFGIPHKSHQTFPSLSCLPNPAAVPMCREGRLAAAPKASGTRCTAAECSNQEQTSEEADKHNFASIDHAERNEGETETLKFTVVPKEPQQKYNTTRGFTAYKCTDVIQSDKTERPVDGHHLRTPHEAIIRCFKAFRSLLQEAFGEKSTTMTAEVATGSGSATRYRRYTTSPRASLHVSRGENKSDWWLSALTNNAPADSECCEGAAGGRPGVQLSRRRNDSWRSSLECSSSREQVRSTLDREPDDAKSTVGNKGLPSRSLSPLKGGSICCCCDCRCSSIVITTVSTPPEDPRQALLYPVPPAPLTFYDSHGKRISGAPGWYGHNYPIFRITRIQRLGLLYRRWRGGRLQASIMVSRLLQVLVEQFFRTIRMALFPDTQERRVASTSIVQSRSVPSSMHQPYNAQDQCLYAETQLDKQSFADSDEDQQRRPLLHVCAAYLCQGHSTLPPRATVCCHKKATDGNSSSTSRAEVGRAKTTPGLCRCSYSVTQEFHGPDTFSHDYSQRQLPATRVSPALSTGRAGMQEGESSLARDSVCARPCGETCETRQGTIKNREKGERRNTSERLNALSFTLATTRGLSPLDSDKNDEEKDARAAVALSGQRGGKHHRRGKTAAKDLRENTQVRRRCVLQGWWSSPWLLLTQRSFAKALHLKQRIFLVGREEVLGRIAREWQNIDRHESETRLHIYFSVLLLIMYPFVHGIYLPCMGIIWLLRRAYNVCWCFCATRCCNYCTAKQKFREWQKHKNQKQRSAMHYHLLPLQGPQQDEEVTAEYQKKVDLRCAKQQRQRLRIKQLPETYHSVSGSQQGRGVQERTCFLQRHKVQECVEQRDTIGFDEYEEHYKEEAHMQRVRRRRKCLQQEEEEEKQQAQEGSRLRPQVRQWQCLYDRLYSLCDRTQNSVRRHAKSGFESIFAFEEEPLHQYPLLRENGSICRIFLFLAKIVPSRLQGLYRHCMLHTGSFHHHAVNNSPSLLPTSCFPGEAAVYPVCKAFRIALEAIVCLRDFCPIAMVAANKFIQLSRSRSSEPERAAVSVSAETRHQGVDSSCNKEGPLSAPNPLKSHVDAAGDLQNTDFYDVEMSREGILADTFEEPLGTSEKTLLRESVLSATSCTQRRAAHAGVSGLEMKCCCPQAGTLLGGRPSGSHNNACGQATKQRKKETEILDALNGQELVLFSQPHLVICGVAYTERLTRKELLTVVRQNLLATREDTEIVGERRSSRDRAERQSQGERKRRAQQEERKADTNDIVFRGKKVKEGLEDKQRSIVKAKKRNVGHAGRGSDEMHEEAEWWRAEGQRKDHDEEIHCLTEEDPARNGILNTKKDDANNDHSGNDNIENYASDACDQDDDEDTDDNVNDDCTIPLLCFKHPRLRTTVRRVLHRYCWVRDERFSAARHVTSLNRQQVLTLLSLHQGQGALSDVQTLKTNFACLQQETGSTIQACRRCTCECRFRQNSRQDTEKETKMHDTPLVDDSNVRPAVPVGDGATRLRQQRRKHEGERMGNTRRCCCRERRICSERLLVQFSLKRHYSVDANVKQHSLCKEECRDTFSSQKLPTRRHSMMAGVSGQHRCRSSTPAEGKQGTISSSLPLCWSFHTRGGDCFNVDRKNHPEVPVSKRSNSTGKVGEETHESISGACNHALRDAIMKQQNQRRRTTADGSGDVNHGNCKVEGSLYVSQRGTFERSNTTIRSRSVSDYNKIAETALAMKEETKKGQEGEKTQAKGKRTSICKKRDCGCNNSSTQFAEKYEKMTLPKSDALASEKSCRHSAEVVGNEKPRTRKETCNCVVRQEEAQALVALLASQSLPTAQPLWQFVLLESVELPRVHEAAASENIGVLGVQGKKGTDSHPPVPHGVGHTPAETQTRAPGAAVEAHSHSGCNSQPSRSFARKQLCTGRKGNTAEQRAFHNDNNDNNNEASLRSATVATVTNRGRRREQSNQRPHQNKTGDNNTNQIKASTTCSASTKSDLHPMAATVKQRETTEQKGISRFRQRPDRQKRQEEPGIEPLWLQPAAGASDTTELQSPARLATNSTRDTTSEEAEENTCCDVRQLLWGEKRKRCSSTTVRGNCFARISQGATGRYKTSSCTRHVLRSSREADLPGARNNRDNNDFPQTPPPVVGSMILFRIHHAVADGIALTNMFLSDVFTRSPFLQQPEKPVAERSYPVSSLSRPVSAVPDTLSAVCTGTAQGTTAVPRPGADSVGPGSLVANDRRGAKRGKSVEDVQELQPSHTGYKGSLLKTKKKLEKGDETTERRVGGKWGEVCCEVEEGSCQHEDSVLVGQTQVLQQDTSFTGTPSTTAVSSPASNGRYRDAEQPFQTYTPDDSLSATNTHEKSEVLNTAIPLTCIPVVADESQAATNASVAGGTEAPPGVPTETVTCFPVSAATASSPSTPSATPAASLEELAVPRDVPLLLSREATGSSSPSGHLSFTKTGGVSSWTANILRDLKRAVLPTASLSQIVFRSSKESVCANADLSCTDNPSQSRQSHLSWRTLLCYTADSLHDDVPPPLEESLPSVVESSTTDKTSSLLTSSLSGCERLPSCHTRADASYATVQTPPQSCKGPQGAAKNTVSVLYGSATNIKAPSSPPPLAPLVPPITQPPILPRLLLRFLAYLRIPWHVCALLALRRDRSWDDLEQPRPQRSGWAHDIYWIRFDLQRLKRLRRLLAVPPVAPEPSRVARSRPSERPAEALSSREHLSVQEAHGVDSSSLRGLYKYVSCILHGSRSVRGVTTSCSVLHRRLTATQGQQDNRARFPICGPVSRDCAPSATVSSSEAASARTAAESAKRIGGDGYSGAGTPAHAVASVRKKRIPKSVRMERRAARPLTGPSKFSKNPVQRAGYSAVDVTWLSKEKNGQRPSASCSPVESRLTAGFRDHRDAAAKATASALAAIPVTNAFTINELLTSCVAGGIWRYVRAKELEIHSEGRAAERPSSRPCEVHVAESPTSQSCSRPVSSAIHSCNSGPTPDSAEKMQEPPVEPIPHPQKRGKAEDDARDRIIALSSEKRATLGGYNADSCGQERLPRASKVPDRATSFASHATPKWHSSSNQDSVCTRRFEEENSACHIRHPATRRYTDSWTMISTSRKRSACYSVCSTRPSSRMDRAKSSAAEDVSVHSEKIYRFSTSAASYSKGTDEGAGQSTRNDDAAACRSSLLLRNDRLNVTVNSCRRFYGKYCSSKSNALALHNAAKRSLSADDAGRETPTDASERASGDPRVLFGKKAAATAAAALPEPDTTSSFWYDSFTTEQENLCSSHVGDADRMRIRLNRGPHSKAKHPNATETETVKMKESRMTIEADVSSTSAYFRPRTLAVTKRAPDTKQTGEALKITTLGAALEQAEESWWSSTRWRVSEEGGTYIHAEKLPAYLQRHMEISASGVKGDETRPGLESLSEVESTKFYGSAATAAAAGEAGIRIEEQDAPDKQKLIDENQGLFSQGDQQQTQNRSGLLHLNIVVPVNLRTSLEQSFQLRNNFTSTVVELAPADLSSAVSAYDRLVKVRTSLRKKVRSIGVCVFGMMERICFATTPDFTWFLHMWLTNKLSMLFSNVPGPSELPQINGRQVYMMHFVGSLVGKVGLNASAFSYANNIDLVLHIDRAVLDSPDLLRQCILEEYQELEHLCNLPDPFTAVQLDDC